jgi:hypothetical protein
MDGGRGLCVCAPPGCAALFCLFARCTAACCFAAPPATVVVGSADKRHAVRCAQTVTAGKKIGLQPEAKSACLAPCMHNNTAFCNSLRETPAATATNGIPPAAAPLLLLRRAPLPPLPLHQLLQRVEEVRHAEALVGLNVEYDAVHMIRVHVCVRVGWECQVAQGGKTSSGSAFKSASLHTTPHHAPSQPALPPTNPNAHFTIHHRAPRPAAQTARGPAAPSAARR